MTAVTRDVLDAIHDKRIRYPDNDLFKTFRPWEQTPSEIANNITPVNYAYSPGDTRRYNTLQDAHDALPDEGGIIYVQAGTISFAGLILTKPVIFKGAGGGISNTNVSATILSYTGSGIAIDVQGGSRGSLLMDFQLINAGTGTIGIRVNNQDPRLINVYLYQTTSGFAGFSVAAIRVGDVNQVNDLLMRDVYVRQQPALGIDLWEVSEGTLDHVRMIQNKGFQLKIGDAANGKTCNGLNLTNGTSPQVANDSASGCILIERSAFKLLIDGMQFESDSVNGTHYSIDARNATVCDLIVIKNSYFLGNSWSGTIAYAISVGLSSANIEVDGCYFKTFGTSAVNNVSAASISFGPGNVLDGCPALVDTFTAAVQQFSGTFTPTTEGGTTTGAGTYNIQQGNFTRNGNRIQYNLRVRWTAHTGTGSLMVAGLPLVSNSGSDTHNAQAVYFNGTDAAHSYLAFIPPGVTRFTLFGHTASVGVAAVALPATGDFIASGEYLV